MTLTPAADLTTLSQVMVLGGWRSIYPGSAVVEDGWLLAAGDLGERLAFRLDAIQALAWQVEPVIEFVD